jgi:hypothetical protein
MIRLGNCFDLLDPENVRDLSRFYGTYRRTLEESGARIPANVRSRKRLNCSVFEFAYASLEAEGQSIDTCRAVFLPAGDSKRKVSDDKMLWAGCGINPTAHIQICVRKPNCILGTWLVKPSEV